MFSQASVILSIGWGNAWQRGVCVANGGVYGEGGMHGEGGHV